MRKFFAIIIVAIISLIHVHLNMFTVENPLNPTFWIYLLYETSPVDGIAFDYISRFAIMGINSLVTAVIASKLLFEKVLTGPHDSLHLKRQKTTLQDCQRPS